MKEKKIRLEFNERLRKRTRFGENFQGIIIFNIFVRQLLERYEKDYQLIRE